MVSSIFYHTITISGNLNQHLVHSPKYTHKHWTIRFSYSFTKFTMYSLACNMMTDIEPKSIYCSPPLCLWHLSMSLHFLHRPINYSRLKLIANQTNLIFVWLIIGKQTKATLTCCHIGTAIDWSVTKFNESHTEENRKSQKNVGTLSFLYLSVLGNSINGSLFIIH